MIVGVKGIVPTKGSDQAAGLDLRYTGEIPRSIPPGERHIVPTGTFMSIPKGYYAQLWSRSGLSAKNGVMVLAGIIDSDYRGEIKVIIYNSDSSQHLVINPGDRVAQLVFCPQIEASLVPVESLDDTDRGAGGFGSSGT